MQEEVVQNGGGRRVFPAVGISVWVRVGWKSARRLFESLSFVEGRTKLKLTFSTVSTRSAVRVYYGESRTRTKTIR